MKTQEKVSIWFDPQMGPFATINNPGVCKDAQIPVKGSVVTTNLSATHGVSFSFPIADFEIKDKKCVRNYGMFCRQIVERRDLFCMEISDALIASVFDNNTDLSLWFIGRDGDTGIIGVTWDKSQ